MSRMPDSRGARVAATAGRRRMLQALAMGALMPARLVLAAPDPRPDGQRLVVVMLRGALDGLAAVPALGDPAWAALRGTEAGEPALRLDGFYGLHPALAELHRWWQQGELLVLHAVASPYRERSHFDAQQLLESGGQRAFDLSTGWLGRAMQLRGQPAVALTSSLPLALRGSDQASTWTPARRAAADDDLVARVGALYRDDPALAAAWTQAMAQQNLVAATVADRGMAGMAPTAGADGFVALAAQAGRLLAADRGPRVAWLDAGGWDTHAQQAPRLQRLLAGLDQGLAALRQALATQWPQTTVLVLTEFGRSAVPNGSGGTDHGTGGIALLAGGAVAGQRVLADWPGLAAAQLLDGRDLRPTRDLRTIIGAVLQRQFGLDPAQLRQTVLPGVSALPPGLALWRA
jgi:uncharacterized protein (DUF1501 family)